MTDPVPQFRPRPADDGNPWPDPLNIAAGELTMLDGHGLRARYIMVDPPYGQDYAEDIWALGKKYPTPAVILRECAEALAPGGRLAFLHQLVPSMPAGLERLGTYGIVCGTETRIRALTIAERRARLDL